MEQFELNGDAFIELNKLIKALNWVSSGGEAKRVIDEGHVKVNGETEMRRRKKLRKGDIVKFEAQTVEIR